MKFDPEGLSAALTSFLDATKKRQEKNDKDSKFKELIDGYNMTLDGKFQKVDMSRPRRCSYSKQTNWKGNKPVKTVMLGKEVRRRYRAKKTANGITSSSYVPMPVEYRGITLHQMRAIKANIIRRCGKEGWVRREPYRDGKQKQIPLTPEIVNLYDIDKYIVKPFTEDSQASFVETLPSTGGTQNPHLFASHWWGEPFFHTLDCIEQCVKDFSPNYLDSHDGRGGGMTIHTPIWFCIFANNQWRIKEELSGSNIDPMKSPFRKAMKISKGTISILDARGIVFSRAWCIFELHVTLTSGDDDGVANVNAGDPRAWAVYTAHKHKYKLPWSTYDPEDRAAVGIISGGAPGEAPGNKSEREKYFPMDLVQLSRDIHIESAQASEDSDLRHILNSIARNVNLDADPPTNHPNYTTLNDAVKGAFAASWPVIIAAAAAGEEEWTDTLDRFSKGVVTGLFTLGLNEFTPRLSSSRVRELVSHIPATCYGLNIWNAEGEACMGAIEGIIEWMRKAKVFKRLICASCKVGNSADDDGSDRQNVGIRLATALRESHHAKSIEVLIIQDTDLIVSQNVSEWESTLKEMASLEELGLYGVGKNISDEEKNILRNASHASDITIKK